MSDFGLTVFGLVFFAAVFGAAMSVAIGSKPLRLAFACLPYLLSCLAAALFRSEDLVQLLLEALLYMALTWVMVWGLRKQLRG